MTTKLQRSRIDKMIAGVAGGLAAYFGVDATIARLALVLLFFISHGAILPIYIILWIVMPQEPAAGVPRYDPYTRAPGRCCSSLSCRRRSAQPPHPRPAAPVVCPRAHNHTTGCSHSWGSLWCGVLNLSALLEGRRLETTREGAELRGECQQLLVAPARPHKQEAKWHPTPVAP